MLTFQLYFGFISIIFCLIFWDSYDRNHTLGSISSGIGLMVTVTLIYYLQSIHFFVK
jgi:hypothetical protein